MDPSGVELDSSQFNAALQRHIAGWLHGGELLLDEVGRVLIEYAKDHAPVDTGELRDSGQSQAGTDETGPYVDLSFGTDHALAQEFGTSTVSPHPFFRPARARARAEIAKRSRTFFK